MRRFRTFFVRVCRLAYDKRKDQEFAEELQSHLQMHIDDNIRFGMTPDQAHREALLKLGGIEQTKQLCRDQRALPLLESFFQDVQFALRSLRKSAGFTTVAILTLASALALTPRSSR
jgi:macrolide transport system ATP-binding/permease protein